VDAGYDDKFVLLGVFFQQGDDFQAGHRVESAGGFVEEKYVWCGNQLACYAHTSLLASRDALADRCADKGISLPFETEAIDQSLDSAAFFVLQDRS
jgi:hypothetical protein